jgi:hypothetical protein
VGFKPEYSVPMTAGTAAELDEASEDRSVDIALDGSFPASDAPPWTLGTSRDARRVPEHAGPRNRPV